MVDEHSALHGNVLGDQIIVTRKRIPIRDLGVTGRINYWVNYGMSFQ